MIFETLHDSSKRGELMLVDGGVCRWHLRRDGQLTIHEIISTRKGAGSQMLRRLELTPGAESLFAKCPADLPANQWYTARGFHVERMEITKSARKLLHWRKYTAYQRRPNVGGLEVIYCANGNPRKAQVAIDTGMLYGAQLPGSVGFRPYFTDQNHNKLKPENTTRDDRMREYAKYIAAVLEHRPQMATVLDWCPGIAWGEINMWAKAVAQYANTVVIIPKIVGSVQDIPQYILGKPVRLGYSVPPQYGGTNVPLREFAGWPHGVHLLGGSPEVQAEIYRQLPNVRSVDTNKHNEMSRRLQYWVGKSHPTGSNKYWPSLPENGETQIYDAPYEAFRRSCVNIMQMWRDVASEGAGLFNYAPTQRALFD